ncbi:MAG: putative signal transduction protein with EAL and GGDEF domain [Paraglaciecola sp.]|jgi:predicted signal transduction protein with EAL and GGDEF domain
MPPSRPPLNTDSNLRRRLLLGSISLAVAVSIIFIVVAYRLASDVGESVELQTSDNQLTWFLNEIKELPLSEKDSEQIKQTIKRNQLFRFFETELIALQLWIDGEKHDIRSHPSTSLISKKVLDSQGKLTASDKIDTEQGRLLWSYLSDVPSGLSVLMIRKISSLDKALEYVANRLSITAFLTFWLAVWAALIMSAIITKRFEENNQKLGYLAMHDPLTGLKNRTFLIEHFARFISDTKTLTGHSKSAMNSALMLIDLNKFKDVNDTFGHAIGDQLLCTLATRIRQLMDKKQVLVRYKGYPLRATNH